MFFLKELKHLYPLIKHSNKLVNDDVKLNKCPLGKKKLYFI